MSFAQQLSRKYDNQFNPDKNFLENMPDLQNGDTIRGAQVALEKVGISNFKLLIGIESKEGPYKTLEASIVGNVSLEASKKGINMSRIIRKIYEFDDHVFNINLIGDILKEYKKSLDSFTAHLFVSFNYPIYQQSLRSKNEEGKSLGGFQFYKICLEGLLDEEGVFHKYLHFDFVYSSACPCSTELSLYAMDHLKTYAIPHSQRSIARISIKFDKMVYIEDLQALCKNALKTETLVVCKREDEMAFAQLNAENPKFVEDAVRLLYESLNVESRILDFKIIASHNESLHSHDAIAVAVKGVKGGFTSHVSVADLKSLVY